MKEFCLYWVKSRIFPIHNSYSIVIIIFYPWTCLYILISYAILNGRQHNTPTLHIIDILLSIKYNIIPRLAFFEHSLTIAHVSTLNCDCIFWRCLPTLLFFDLECIPATIQSASNSLVHYSNSPSTIYSLNQNSTPQSYSHPTITQFSPNFIWTCL